MQGGYLETRINQVQSVIRFFEDPCEAPWTVYFELALEPAGDVVLELLTFGLDDIVRGYFRPRGIYRRGRQGILARRIGRFLNIPEIGEMVGSHLPGAQTIRSRTVSQGVRFLWIVDGVLQRGLFWWMIADLLTEFLYEWTSSVAETEFCRSTNAGAFCCPVQTGDAFTSLGWSTIGPDLMNCEKAWGNIVTGGSSYAYQGMGFTSASVTTKELLPPFGGTQMRVVRSDGTVIVPPTNLDENPDGTHTGVVGYDSSPGWVTLIQLRAGSGVGIVTGGTICGWGRPS